MDNGTIIAIIILIAIVIALIIIIKYYLPEQIANVGTPELVDNIIKFNQKEPATEEEE